MTIYAFDQITKAQSFLGGKGYSLGLMKNAGYPVPDGLILTELPVDLKEWEEIFAWWEKNESPALAIRSSAIGEDSNEQSFAGQNSSFLNITYKEGIKTAVAKCFESIHKKSSALYRQHFLKTIDHASMNVVIQLMVKPLYSGVFFSVDPRTGESGWIAEAILGFGEDLVSGKKTPLHFEENKEANTSLFDITEVVKTGLAIRDFFETEIDIEWAIDQQNHLKILQARPITALSGKSEEKRMIDEELNRLLSEHHPDTIWDGGTFAEWSSPPSLLTFSIWSEAFAKDHAFSKALKKLGYLGIDHEVKNNTHSLLERIFDRGYINISLLSSLYFGPIPYRIVFKNGPQLKFDFSKINLETIVKTPLTIARMISVSFKLSSQRKEWLNESRKELIKAQAESQHLPSLEQKSNDELFSMFEKEVQNFYDNHLLWSLVLITLIETTNQNLKALLKGVLTEDQIKSKLNLWMGAGIHSVTMEMNQEYTKACLEPETRKSFIRHYGHRGPGELELSNPRWAELSDKAFVTLAIEEKRVHATGQFSAEEEISQLQTYKKQVIEKEWILLRDLLEMREQWKMQILKPYFNIRLLSLEIAKRFNLGENIFWFSYQEILKKEFNQSLAQKRKAHSELSKNISLPTIIELSKLQQILKNKDNESSDALKGEALSPGLVFGEVRVVLSPDGVDLGSWPTNTVIVAESTDPGWTGLFLKSKAIIVEKGGVLSHCAIVAREMNLPAISGIKNCHHRFKDGDKIWVDGNNGTITLA